jgi:hypothetical protein
MQRVPPVPVGRTVTFNDVLRVRLVLEDPPELYIAARKGHWMQCAVDRHRFERRIRRTDQLFDGMFCEEHRNNMWYYINKMNE